ncbi:uncharacterized protein N7482_002174 [Penicillium canariense]|uniref:N-acetyltransferase domain-containing protein n=1 Tax=Penicillium canariense TaxID=189055 RepID=A0A9W9LUW5_9EURO|nr:uncharacterized protein N7482_002174 [Penicillium canariense]KAJ5176297.1 hypothetical protein N7482_002174 [Penicillium canariense]
MASTCSAELPEPFALLTARLVVVPTPIAVNVASYRTLYAALHSDVDFCKMGFGEHFPARGWSDDETRQVIETRDIERSWRRHGLGDFAVGFRATPGSEDPDKASSQNPHSSVSILRGSEYEQFAGHDMTRLDEIEWVGYAGVRDATTTSLPPQSAGDPTYPPWFEMVEIRYGVSPACWGGGIAREAAEAVLQWAARKKGVKRFIAETEKENQRSARLLQKLGFVASGTDYWKEPSETEWELVIQ